MRAGDTLTVIPGTTRRACFVGPGSYVDDVYLATTVTHVRVSNGASVSQLVCHPKLPLVAGLAAELPAVHVWDCNGGKPRELGATGTAAVPYGDGDGRWHLPRALAVADDRGDRGPVVAWHPEQPLLIAATGGVEGQVVRWTPDGGFRAEDRIQPVPPWQAMAFSPDGRALWVGPSRVGGRHGSKVIDLASGAVTGGAGWDTGIALHPGGALAATMYSDQAATHVLFARLEGAAAALRIQRRALILDADGYQTPVFNADGRYLAIRGNSYENSLEVFAFPSLTRVLGLTLGPRHVRGGLTPEEDREYRAWSRHNIAFGAAPGVLWVGTPDGTLVEADLDAGRAARHDVLGGAPVTALCATPAGDLVTATADGTVALVPVLSTPAPDDRQLALFSLPAPAPAPAVPGPPPSRELAAAFLAATGDVPGDGDLDELLDVTDGSRSWAPGALSTVTTSDASDPAWLRQRAALNEMFTRGR